MENNNILYIPIQINGGEDAPGKDFLKERELFVLDNGTLYVGKRDGDGVIATTVIGRVVEGAEVKNATLKGCIKVGRESTDNIVIPKNEFNSSSLSKMKSGTLLFIDNGEYTFDEDTGSK